MPIVFECFTGMEKNEINRNMSESAIVYSSTNSEGSIEYGKISKPESEGKIIPQTRNSKN